ncbi:MAG TPA: trypsin-like peptidase domain-containing protein [Saprospiraceae bacterium]|nr:trypsin-like peptidase domain-containing protein [Saprospiraceae bacterium]HMP23823.1 trypsin-like peptidase domain-containing protein [Saprospiraceae bacterium]
MNDIIELYRNVVIQIATPYSTGTGFYLKQPNLIVTNEHVVRDNDRVVVDGDAFAKQLVRVIYVDPRHDLAFLEPPQQADIPAVQLGTQKSVREGDQVLAIGHPLGLKYTATKGIVSNTRHEQGDVLYIQHDAALSPGNSGGPLVDDVGDVVGVNTFIMRDGNSIGFSLPARYLAEAVEEFIAQGRRIGARCLSCSNLVFEDTIEQGYCPHCGAKIKMPSQTELYEPIGVAKTIEDIITRIGYDVALARVGPNKWEIQQGSAKIYISYYEKTGLITGDAYLCTLPKENIKPLYEYLLRQNYHMEGLTFSIREQDIILSLLIFDRYLNVETGANLFRYLFEKADEYDNILVETYGALWKYEPN